MIVEVPFFFEATSVADRSRPQRQVYVGQTAISVEEADLRPVVEATGQFGGRPTVYAAHEGALWRAVGTVDGRPVAAPLLRPEATDAASHFEAWLFDARRGEWTSRSPFGGNRFAAAPLEQPGFYRSERHLQGVKIIESDRDERAMEAITAALANARVCDGLLHVRSSGPLLHLSKANPGWAVSPVLNWPIKSDEIFASMFRADRLGDAMRWHAIHAPDARPPHVRGSIVLLDEDAYAASAPDLVADLLVAARSVLLEEMDKRPASSFDVDQFVAYARLRDIDPEALVAGGEADATALFEPLTRVLGQLAVAATPWTRGRLQTIQDRLAFEEGPEPAAPAWRAGA